MMRRISHKYLKWIIHKIGSLTLITIILLASILLITVFSLQNILTVEFGLQLKLATLIGLILSWLFARSKLSPILSFFILFILGFVFTVLNTLQLWGLVVTLIDTYSDWIISNIASLFSEQLIFSSNISLIWENLGLEIGILFSKTLASWQGLLSTGPRYDPLVAKFTWSFLFWLVSAWAGWVYRRLDQPLVSLIPVAVLFAGSLSYTRSSSFYLVPFIAGVFVFITWNRYQIRQVQWQDKKTDIAEAIKMDLALWVSALSMIIILISLLIAYISPQRIFQSAREFSASHSDPSQDVAQTLGLNPQTPAGLAGLQPGSGSLPRSHLIGSPPELSQEIAWIIQVDPIEYSNQTGNNEFQPTKLYFREFVFDQYTTTGWKTSQTEIITIRSGDLIHPDPGSQRVLSQRIEYSSQSGQVLAYFGIPIRINQAVLIEQRSPIEGEPDIFAIVENQPFRINNLQIETTLNNIGEDQLSRAGIDYPQVILERYLQLPEGFPVRVQALSQEITSPFSTPYSKAKAIESYLRNYPYSLQIPQPPTDKDISEYFLFDIKTGYCDYYATAMTVMARSIGIPARLVVGYIGGEYNQDTGRYIISQANAHSWVEIFFPEVGWVEFEPTASMELFNRPLNSPPSPQVDESLAQAQRPSLESLAVNSWITWILLTVIFLVSLVVIWFLADLIRYKKQDPSIAIDAIYWRLNHLANQAYLSTRINPTPNEFQDDLLHQISNLQNSKLIQKLLCSQRNNIRTIIQNFNQISYSPTPANREMQEISRKAWNTLRARFWMVRLWKSIRKNIRF